MEGGEGGERGEGRTAFIQTTELKRMRRWDGEGMITGREGEVEKWKGDEMGERARCFLGAGTCGAGAGGTKVRLEKNRRL